MSNGAKKGGYPPSRTGRRHPRQIGVLVTMVRLEGQIFCKARQAPGAASGVAGAAMDSISE